MHLNKLFSANHLHMRPHFIRDLMRPYCAYRQLHRQQAVRISAEGFSVKEIPPAPENLSCHQSYTGRIQHQGKRNFFNSAVHIYGGNCPDNCPVDRNASLSQIKNTEQVILIIIPGENHIISSRTDNGKYNRINYHICVGIRILPGPLCLPFRQVKPQQNGASHNNPVISNFKAKNRDRFSHMLQADTQMRKANHCIHQ